MSSSFFFKKVKLFITDETVDLMMREIADQDPWVCVMMLDALTSHLLKPLLSLDPYFSQLFCCGPRFHCYLCLDVSPLNFRAVSLGICLLLVIKSSSKKTWKDVLFRMHFRDSYFMLALLPTRCCT